MTDAMAMFELAGKQHQFVVSPSRRIAFFGGIRAGKTIGGCLRVLLWAHEFPGIPQLVARATYPQLMSTTLKEMEQIVSKLNGGSLAPGPYLKRYVRSTTGVDALTMYVVSKDPQVLSPIRFAYADNLDVVLGSEYGAAYIDQAEGVREDIVEHIDSRLSWWNSARSREFRNAYGYAPKSTLSLTGNPDPGWVYRWFKEGAKSSQKWEFIEIQTKENVEHLPLGYVEEQTTGKPILWVKRWLEGSWDIRGGQVYPEFDESVHTVEPFRIPEHWPRIIAMDYGWGHPFAVYWGAVDEEGCLYVYREFFDKHLLASAIAEGVKEKSEHDPVKRWDGRIGVVMPSDMWKHDGTGLCAAEEMAQMGLLGTQANRSLEAGLMRVSERLHPVEGRVGLRIFKGTCPELIKGMRLYTMDEATGQPIKKDDDAADALRYLVMAAQGIRASREQTAEPDISFDEYAARTLRDEALYLDKGFGV